MTAFLAVFKVACYFGFVQPKFCEEVFPMLVHDVLVHGSAEHRQLLSLKLTEFFTAVCSDLPSPGRATTPLPSMLTISLNNAQESLYHLGVCMLF